MLFPLLCFVSHLRRFRKRLRDVFVAVPWLCRFFYLLLHSNNLRCVDTV